MSGATIQARPVAYMTAEGAMSANFMFPPAPIFGPPQYFSGRGNRGDSISPFQFVNPNQPYAPIDFTGYPPGYGNVPFSESKPIIHDTQEAAAKALLSLQNSSSGTTTSHSSIPTTMAVTSRLAGFINEDQTPDLISALRQSTAFGPGETINAAGGLDPRVVSSCGSIDYHHPDIKPINLIQNVAHVVTSDATHTTAVSGINGMAERSPTANKPRPKSKSGNNICQICGKSYARPSTLKTHLRTHSGEKPYRCDICGKAFTQAANLTAHLRTHSGEKPFSCPICQKRFSQSSSVTTHLRTHSGERPYRCDFCGKCFADTSTLTKHKRIHSGEKPYRCKICNLGFSQSGNLHRHMKTHNNN